MNKYTPVIGLEVHVELKTKSKMFCGCSADYFGKEPNTHTCPVCLGLPGALPVPNKKAIDWCIMIGQALNCEIPLFSKFDRKNYFYPDLPKGYQISQYDQPFATDGFVILNSPALSEAEGFQDLKTKGEIPKQVRHDTEKKIRIKRVHMEEDTAKLMHQFGSQKSPIRQAQGKNQNDESYSLIDFNRSGVPLVEIVTEPDFETTEEVKEYLQKVQQIVRYLDVSDANMERGDMRLEPNISLRSNNTNTTNTTNKPISNKDLPPYKVEVKNINSFRFVEKAINFEIQRQSEILDKGETPVQETRGFVEVSNSTVSQRTKEEAADYRYFPEPDIPPFRWRESQISNFKSQMPELPDVKKSRFEQEYKLSTYDAEILTREKFTAEYFEGAIVDGKKFGLNVKQIANYLINKRPNIEEVLPAQLIQGIVSSSKVADVDEEKLDEIIEKVLKDNPKAISDFKKGKESVIMFLVGQVMRQFPKKIDAGKVKASLLAKLNK
ncbi:MAG: Asp-tRNA(Asn)/Glu-tRNA(Gln) amidotransferase subunit GatB [Candidatus Levybacteria bacterium]|nr:Asp-tRNA(Asn)/Glu-tRNA(Gln) amidotransferase subunit GatB [Candidatus Levybacteria bacterium]